ncbi:MAG: hypothetical protein ABSB09_06440 [Acidimicrobiales bacterium]
MPIRIADRIEFVTARSAGLDAAPFGRVTAATVDALRRVVAWHTTSSPNSAYRNLLEERGIQLPLRLDSVEDLGQLPIMDKATLASNGYSTTPGIAGPVIWVETSGTTAAQVRIPHSPKSIRSGLGDSFLRTLGAAGLGSSSRYWTIGHRAWPGQVTGSYLSFEWLQRILGEKALVTNTVDDLAEQLCQARDHVPDCIASAPGFLTRLAFELADQSSISLRPAVVLYGGASLNSDGRAAICGTLRPDTIAAFYPTTDAGPLAMSVPDDGIYRCFTETHHAEVVDSTGQPVGPGERGELLVTVLHNTAAPLIRYRVGDEVTLVARGNRTVLTDIVRRGDAILGDGILPLGEIQRLADELYARGHAVQAVQLRVRSSSAGIDEAVLRLFGPDVDHAAEEAARLMLLKHHQIDHAIISGSLAPIVVERVRAPDSADAGWKIPPFVDERHTSRPSR